MGFLFIVILCGFKHYKLVGELLNKFQHEPNCALGSVSKAWSIQGYWASRSSTMVFGMLTYTIESRTSRPAACNFLCRGLLYRWDATQGLRKLALKNEGFPVVFGGPHYKDHSFSSLPPDARLQLICPKCTGWSQFQFK